MQKKSIEKIKDEKGSVFGYVLKPNGKIDVGGAVGAVAGAGTEYLIDALVKSDNW